MKNLNEFIGTFSNANKFHGIDFQPEENDSRENYRSRFDKKI